MELATNMHRVGAPTAPHAIARDAGVLQQITDPGVNLSLWQRSPDLAVVREVSALQASHLRDVRRRTSAHTFDADVCTLLQLQGLDPSAFIQLRADLCRLAARFERVSAGRDMRFRLFTTDKDDCRRFHLDRTHLRLLCTYRGPGTEWLPDAQVDRTAQARGLPNEAIIRFGEPSRFEPFWVGIMRGDPTNIGEGLVHRSPPVAGSGQVRVLFCLDC